jgi:hypothetical protein
LERTQDAAAAEEAAAEPTAAIPEAGEGASPTMEERPMASRRRRAGRLTPEGWAGLVGAAALVAVLVPLVLISRYNHSYADDWHYGVWAHLALEDTGSVLAAIGVALEQVPKAWFEWQGTYTAIFVMALEPSVFGEGCYVIAAPLVMAVLVAGSLFFWHVVACELLHGPKGTWVAVSCVTCALQLLLQPSAVEGIFWYNSASYYTGFHALMLVYFGLLLRAACLGQGKAARRASVWAGVVGALLAGGNFVTVLVSVELSAAVLAVLFARRDEGMVRVLPGFCLLVLGAVVSMVAPGNSVRQATQFPDARLGVAQTVWQSSMAGFEWLARWSGGLVALGVLALVPLLARIVASPQARRWQWRLPGLVSVGSVALFATSFTPTFFSMGNVGPGRVQNARFDLLVVLLVLNALWWCGWAAARRASEAAESGTVAPSALSSRTAAALSCALVGICVLCALAVGADSQTQTKLSSASAAESLATGEAAEYDRQVWERIELIESSGADVEVPFYSAGPHVLFMGDVRDSMGNYINYRLAQWYRKDSIVGVNAVS